MRIAAIVVCYNDDYKLKEWIDNYSYYSSSIYKLIIVDNGSEKSFIEKVKGSFSDATIILREKNGGTTGAYNDGIKEALSDKSVEAIMLIGNDIKINNESIETLANALLCDDVGMVSPVLLRKDSLIIEDAGSTISYYLYMKPQNVGKAYGDISHENEIVQSVTGGMNLSTREFYEKVGLQDEKLFMYSDEVDIGIRAARAGYKMMIVKSAVAWHQHINPNKRENRLPYSNYLMARNKIYISKKSYNLFRTIIIFIRLFIDNFLRVMKAWFEKRDVEPYKYAIRGLIQGLIGNMIIPDEFELC